MNARNVISITISLVVGSAIGAWADRYYLFGPHRAVLDVSPYSTNLMQHSAWLLALKRNDVDCAKKSIQSTLFIDLKNADFYRNYASKTPDALKRLEQATKFADEALIFKDQPKNTISSSCT